MPFFSPNEYLRCFIASLVIGWVLMWFGEGEIEDEQPQDEDAQPVADDSEGEEGEEEDGKMGLQTKKVAQLEPFDAVDVAEEGGAVLGREG